MEEYDVELVCGYSRLQHRVVAGEERHLQHQEFQMEFECNLLTTLRRAHSDIAFDDAQSEILAGNLSIRELSSDEEEETLEEEDETLDINNEDLTIEDLQKADDLINESLGVSNVVTNLIKLLLSGKFSPTQILIQALCYKIQSSVKGKHSVRYLDSYGMFWAGVRNLLKTRGLIVFQEHFPIPSDLSKMKKKVLETCCLDKNSLGKSGIQRKNVELWIDGKQKESAKGDLGVSIAIDGKRIAATIEGIEDMAGLGGTDTVSDEMKQHEINKTEMLELLAMKDRKSCFLLFDKLTLETAKIVSKLDAVEKLIVKNSKQLERNQNLAKYVFVLNQQKDTGRKLVGNIHNIQRELISCISVDRKSENVIQDPNSSFVDLSFQQNYYGLPKIDNDIEVMERIQTFLKKCKTLLDVPWHEIVDDIHYPMEMIGRDCVSFKKLFKLCYMSDNQVFNACGLSKQRPLAEMKEVYNQVHSKVVSFDPPKKPENKVIATFCANFASVTFGKNMVVKDGGFFVRNGVCSTPDLVVVENLENDKIEFTVKLFRVEGQTFKFTEEMVVASLMCSLIAKSSRGCLLVLHSDVSFVVFNIPRNDGVAINMLKFVENYIKQPKCLTKRTKEMCNKIEALQNNIREIVVKTIVTLGSYPQVKEVHESPHGIVKAGVIVPKSMPKPNIEIKDLNLIKTDLVTFLDGTKKFMSKQAKELICVNISELSGSSSKHNSCCNVSYRFKFKGSSERLLFSHS